MDLSGYGLDVHIAPIEHPDFWQNWEFWLFSATLGLVAVTAWLAVATGRLVQSSERIARIQTRAYVTVTDLRPEPFKGAQPFRYHVVAKNAGTTPAFEFTMHEDLIMAAAPETVPWPNLPQTRGSGILGPGQATKLDGGERHGKISNEDLASLRAGELRAVLFLVFNYTDIYGRPQRVRHRAATTPPAVDGQMSLQLLETIVDHDDSSPRRGWF